LNLLFDIITYIRRIIKTPSNQVITDNLIIDYINRFWLMDVDARIQLFDLKTTYQFQTQPGVDQYNMPLYNLQVEGNPNTSISYYPVYQGFINPAFINGIQVPMQSEQSSFYNIWPDIVQQLPVVAVGNGTSGPYSFQFPIVANFNTPPNPPLNGILRGHVDITGIVDFANNTSNLQDPPIVTALNTSIPSTSVDSKVWITSIAADGSNIVVQDSGQFLEGSTNNGLLMSLGEYPLIEALPNGYLNSFAITGASQATQCILTATTTFQPGESVLITGVSGMTQLNNNMYTVVANGGTTLTINVNSTGFTAYTSGGTVSAIQNVVNYLSGQVTNLYFPEPIPEGNNINANCFFFQSGLPRGILYYNNSLILRSPPDQSYLVKLTAYLSPAAYLNSSSAVQFAYMSEYIARGAARKILADIGDIEQFQFYEPLFKEQETLVWKRSQRQFTNTRTSTIYSEGINQGQSGFNNLGGSTL
jgi:Ubiquitin-activating enzyme E1 FCCH domain